MPDADQKTRDPARDQVAAMAALNQRLQREIIERQAVEQRLRTSERHLRESQRLAGIGSWEFDPVTGNATWSDEMYRIFGRTPGEFVPTLANVAACMEAEDAAAIADTMARIRATLQPSEYTHRFIRPDGAVRHLQGFCNFTRDRDGTLERFIGIARDVTEQRLQESNLDRVLADLRQLKAIVDRSPVVAAIVSLAGTGAIEYVSDGVRQFGYEAEEVVTGRVSWRQFMLPEDHDRIAGELTAHLEAGRRQFAVTLRLVTRAGGIRWMHVDVTALPPAAGDHPTHLQCFMADVTAQHEAEARVWDLAALNETIITAAPVGIAACDAAGRCVFANPAMGHIVNATVDQLLRQNIHELASWRESGLLKLALEALATGEPQSDVVHVQSSFGREAWLDVTFTRFRSNGAPHVLLICHNITEGRQAEARLRQTELRYRLLAESIPDMMYLVEPDGTVLYANTFAGRQFGLTPEQMVGKRQEDLFTREVADRHARVIRQVAETGQPFLAEVPDVLDPEHPVWIDTRLIPIRTPAGRVTAVMGLSRDVTERRAMTAALQESEQKYRQLFESMSEGCLLHDLLYDRSGVPFDALVTAMNPAAEAILGAKASEVVGKRASVFTPDGKPLFLDIYTALDRGQPPVSIESFVPFAGKHLFLSFFSPRKGRIATIFNDISVRKATEERMAQYQQQLRHLAAEMAVAGEQERRRIAVNLHDGLGQSLVLCKMKLEAAKAAADTALKRQLQPAIRLIEAAIRDTRSLTFQLSPPVLHEIGLSAAVEWLAEQLGSEHGVPIKVTGRAAREPTGVAERVTLFQSVRELLLNTIKHARAATITVGIRLKQDRFEIVVKDDGVGFDVRALQGARRKGLGFFNIQERLQLIGGSMAIRSQPGKGTSITLETPVDAPAGEGGTP